MFLHNTLETRRMIAAYVVSRKLGTEIPDPFVSFQSIDLQITPVDPHRIKYSHATNPSMQIHKSGQNCIAWDEST